jgi:hypothetical protein
MRRRGKERKVTKNWRMPLPEALSLKGLRYNVNNGEGTEETHQTPQSDTWLSETESNPLPQ